MEKETLQYTGNGEIIPFNLLNPIQQDILQKCADGYTNEEMAADLKLDVKTIEYRKQSIARIGLERSNTQFYHPTMNARNVITALIQDGINQGYLHHDAPSNKEFKKLSSKERVVMERILEGDSNEKTCEKLGITKKTVEAHRSTIYKKLRLRRGNIYNAVARYAYIQKHDLFEKNKEKNEDLMIY